MPANKYFKCKVYIENKADVSVYKLSFMKDNYLLIVLKCLVMSLLNYLEALKIADFNI